MEILLKLFICLVAGAGAGLGTGFAGLSAAAVISPLLIAFLGLDAYMAVGIGLASDVLASASSSVIYAKHKNIDIKNGIVLMITVLAMTVVGSFIADKIDHTIMGNISYISTFFLGLSFIIKPDRKQPKAKADSNDRFKLVKTILCGAMIGFICGFVGAGGGMMMLFALSVVLHYEIKTAVGTSVFVMAFTALTGSISHFMIGDAPDLFCLIACIIFTLLFAILGSQIANRVSDVTAKRATGIILVIIGLSIFLVKFIFKQ